jgi:hypothetical protein
VQGLDLFGRATDLMDYDPQPDLPDFILRHPDRFLKYAPRHPLLTPLPHTPPREARIEAHARKFVPLDSPFSANACCAHRTGSLSSSSSSSSPEGEPCRVMLAIGIVSHARHVQRRDAIRGTWLARLYDSNLGPFIRHRFIVGLDDGRIRHEVLEEARRSGDLLIMNLTESYAHVHNKEIAAFVWGIEACGAHHVLKANDDVYLDLPPVMQELINRGPASLYAGHFMGHADLLIPRPELVDSASRKTLTMDIGEFPYNNLPHFAQGNAVILSRALAEDVAAYAYKPWFPPLPGDIQIGMIVGQRGQGVVRLPIQTDFSLDGKPVSCRDGSAFQFDIGVDAMRVLHDNVVNGRPRCLNVSAWTTRKFWGG